MFVEIDQVVVPRLLLRRVRENEDGALAELRTFVSNIGALYMHALSEPDPNAEVGPTNWAEGWAVLTLRQLEGLNAVDYVKPCLIYQTDERSAVVAFLQKQADEHRGSGGEMYAASLAHLAEEIGRGNHIVNKGARG